VRPIAHAFKNLRRGEISMTSSTATKVPNSAYPTQSQAPAGSPLAFTDAQLDVVMKHAMPLHPRVRRAFVEHVAASLRGQEIGDGSLHRACVMVWKQMFDPPLETTHESKWSR
jgi:hypothetical protein